MNNLIHDLKYSVRLLLKNPGFTAVVVLTLALGVGANTAIFSIVNSIVLRPLPYPDADRLAMLWMDNSRINVREDWHSYAAYADYRDQSRVFEHLAAFNNRSFNLTGEGEAERILGAHGTADLFQVLGVNAAMGRVFTVDEEEPGKDTVIVLGHGLWTRRFGGDPDAIGREISLSGTNRTVIGVMPPGFRFPSSDSEFWIPMALSPQRRENRNSLFLQVIGRLKPEVTLEQAIADVTSVNQAMKERFGEAMDGYGVHMTSLHHHTVGKVSPALLVLLGAVGFVLLMACVNIANLLLARLAVREREISIRAAMGAGRWRLVRQLLTESTVLAILGGAAGVGVAIWGLEALIRLSPPDIPRLDQVGIDWSVLGFTASLALGTGFLFGMIPAIHSSRPDLNRTLKEAGRGLVGSTGGRLRKSLIVVEVALSLVLLAGAGLMLKSFAAMQNFDLGFNPERLLTMKVQLAGANFNTGPAITNFYSELIERIEALPGVRSAGAITTIFLSETPDSANFSIEGRPAVPTAQRVEVPIDVVSQGYFRTMRIPLTRGREFIPADDRETPRVAIINERMAEMFWPGEDPVGQRYKYGPPESESPWLRIVGVVADMRRTGFDAEVRPETFLPLTQAAAQRMEVVISSETEPLALASAVRDQVRSIDPNQPAFEVKSMESRLDEMMAQRRLTTVLFGTFALSGLVLACVGIYGVMAYSVSERTHEMGIRMALGASARDIIWLVMRQALTLTAAGLLLGLGAAFLLTRVMSGILFQVDPMDPSTFATVTLILAAAALLAGLMPGRRATRVDPMTALRCE